MLIGFEGHIPEHEKEIVIIQISTMARALRMMAGVVAIADDQLPQLAE